MVKHFACNGDGNLPCIGLSVEAIAQIGKNGDIRYLCSACGRPVVIEDLSCDHEWEVVSSSWIDGGAEHIHAKCKCGETREGRRVTWWIDA